MVDQNAERRKHNRAVFTLEDGVTGVISIPGEKEKPITAFILNLSSGGAFFHLKPGETFPAEVGDTIVLVKIKGSPVLDFLVNIDADIKWILNPPVFKYVGVGCEFKNVPPSSQDQIRKFVESWKSGESS